MRFERACISAPPTGSGKGRRWRRVSAPGAEWHFAHGRTAEAAQLYHEANEVDPFSRKLHERWAGALAAAERWEEALREYGVALIVPPTLDRDHPAPLAGAERAKLLAGAAAALVELERFDEARSTAETALAADADCVEARAVLDRLGP